MAQTPWGDSPVNDAHVHFFSHSFFDALARQKRLEGAGDLGPILKWEIPSTDPGELAKRWLAEMTRFGVQRMALIGSAAGEELQIASAVATAPDRFFGYFILDPVQTDAEERMSRVSANSGLHAVCLFPAMHQFSVCDSRVTAILEIASAAQMAVFVHCGALSVGVRNKLGLSASFDMRYSNPLDLHAQAKRFPQTPFIMPHFGAGLFREALMLADLCGNVFLDTSSSNRWMAYEGLDLRAVFKRSIDVLGFERLVFGTDSSFFPRGWNAPILEQQATALYELGLTQQQASLILSKNLERILTPRLSALTQIQLRAGAS